VRQYVPFSARTADALRDRFIGATQATVLGTGVICLAQGVLVGLGFAISGLPEPLFWGAVAAVAAVIPAIGTTIIWLPGMLLLVSQHHYGAAVTLFVFGFGLAGNVDQIIRPLVYRRISEMHPMVTFVGVLAGLHYLGVVGLLLGPLAIVYVFELLRFYREEYISV
jgi:predicted PurR-regulated permease PerM